MWRLDETQKALVARYFYIAEITARKIGNRRDPDSSLSASCYGLCRAAYKWRPDGGRTFRDYAIRACRSAITEDYKKNAFVVGWRSRAPVEIETNSILACNKNHNYKPIHPIDALISTEERLLLSQALPMFTACQRDILELKLAGMRNCDIQKQLSLGRSVVYVTIERAMGRLKKMVNR